MSSKTWQQAILSNFQPKKESMLLVIDPDNLMRDDTLLAEIQNSNYDVLELNDEVTFRNKFERTYRSRWDNHETRHLVVVVHTTNGARHIPYDLRQKSKIIELSVSELFPHLNAITVSQLDNAYYTELYPAHQQLVAHNEKLRGERQTIEFILRIVFDLEPAAIGNPARWIEFLIDKHYSARELPPALEEYLRQNLLPGVSQFGLRPEFLADAAAFYTWLGEQWAAYIAHLAGSGEPPAIDFADNRLRPLLGYLFTEGLLPRAPVLDSLPVDQEWLAIGLTSTQKMVGWQGAQGIKEVGQQALYNLKARLGRFQAMSTDSDDLPTPTTDVRDWLNLAAEWAEVVFQANSLPSNDYHQVQPDLAAARQTLDDHFWDFVQSRYRAVSYYEDNKGPISLMAVNQWFSRQIDSKNRLALLCFDGLALDQWLLLRDYLQSVLPDLAFRENRTYAIAPTITPVSRQALFAGRPPIAFTETLNKTNKDAERWQAYWVNHNIPERRVAHLPVKVNGQGLEELPAIVDSKNVRLAVLINLFDDVMHASKDMPAEADKRVYYDTLRSHLQNGRLAQLFDTLLTHNYRLFITADHGNIAGIGNGLRPPRDLIESYARRVIIFDKESLANEYAQTHQLRQLPLKTLPPDFHPVYLPGNQLLDTQGATKISHGGLSLEELVVPFVEVMRA